MKNNKYAFSARDLSFTAVSAVLITVCSWIVVPYTVPFTMQTFGIFFSFAVLGGRRSFFAVLVYILLGMVGLPVFSGGMGGIGVILGPTGGYIAGFLLSAIVYSVIEKYFGMIRSMVIAQFVCYISGTAWFMLISDGAGFISVATVCVIPFVIPDAVKIIAAATAGKTLKKRIKI